jgi:dihydroorotate dehydrogenase (NAD+) catalytic subunit
VSTGRDAVEFLMAGASAVQVGTATFRDPEAPWKVLAGLTAWCEQAGVQRLEEIVGAARRRD